TPAIVERIELIAHRLPGEWRLAARSLGRRRGHSAAMVAAVCATAALSLAASSYVVGRRSEPHLVPGLPADQVRVTAARVSAGRTERIPVPDQVSADLHREVPEAGIVRFLHL